MAQLLFTLWRTAFRAGLQTIFEGRQNVPRYLGFLSARLLLIEGRIAEAPEINALRADALGVDQDLDPIFNCYIDVLTARLDRLTTQLAAGACFLLQLKLNAFERGPPLTYVVHSGPAPLVAHPGPPSVVAPVALTFIVQLAHPVIAPVLPTVVAPVFLEVTKRVDFPKKSLKSDSVIQAALLRGRCPSKPLRKLRVTQFVQKSANGILITG